MSGNKKPCLGIKGLRGEQNNYTHAYTHTAGEGLYTILSSIFDSLVTLRLIIRA